MQVYNIVDFGAFKDSEALATDAISRAIEAASEVGEERCMFHPVHT